MALNRTDRRTTGRRGAAAVELAVLLPLLLFLFLIAVDFARVFYFSTTVANCARNGALYESDAYSKAESRYKSVTEAALADAPNLRDPANQPTVTSTTGSDATGQAYVEVTVSYTFRTVSAFPLIPDQVNVTRSVRMARAPMNPTR